MNGIVEVKFQPYGKTYYYIIPNHIRLKAIGKYVIVDSPFPTSDVTTYVIAEVVDKIHENMIPLWLHATKPIIDTIDDSWYNKYKENIQKEKRLNEQLDELWNRYSATEKQKIIRNWQGDII